MHLHGAKKFFEVFLLGAMFFAGCATPSTSRSNAKSPKKWRYNQTPFTEQNLAGLSRNNVTSNVPYSTVGGTSLVEPVKKRPPYPFGTPAAAEVRKKPKPSGASSVEEQCEAAVEKWLKPWREVYPSIKPENLASLPRVSAHSLSAKKLPPCRTPQDRNQVISALTPLVSHHKNKVVIIAPLSGPHAAVGKGVATGMQLALAEAGLDPNASLVTMDAEEWSNEAAMTRVKDRNSKLDEQLTTALIRDGAAVIVAALDMASEQHLISRSRDLDFPLLLLANGAPDSDLRGLPAFRIVPNLTTMAQALATTAQNRNFKKIAVLKPSDGRSDAMIESFVKAFVANGGSVSYLGSYTAGSYESMDAVVQSAFKINAPERRGEMEQLFHQKKQEAALAGEVFNPKLVILPPQSDFDAVFLPDDFRTVRHFAKILRYHGVRTMPFLGHQGWRSRGLLEPYDRFLEGSVFVDYVGSYGQLPAPLNAAAYTDPENSWFIAPEFASALDFHLIGYRAGTIALAALKNPQEKRRNLAAIIRKAPNRQAGYFAASFNFDVYQKALWPAFLFSIYDGNLNLHPTPTLSPVSQSRPTASSKAVPAR